MPAELFTRINLDQLYPPFVEKLLEVVAERKAAGQHFHAISGYRSAAEQLKLWQQGRNAAGAVVEPKKVVTTLKFGMHQLGLAVDFCRDADLVKAGLQPSWEAEGYRPLAEAGEGVGLEAGFFWKSFRDPPHLQLPLGPRKLTISKLKSIHDAEGLLAVWKLLDIRP